MHEPAICWIPPQQGAASGIPMPGCACTQATTFLKAKDRLYSPQSTVVSGPMRGQLSLPSWSVLNLTTFSRPELPWWTSRQPHRSAGAGRPALPAGAPGTPGNTPRLGLGTLALAILLMAPRVRAVPFTAAAVTGQAPGRVLGPPVFAGVPICRRMF